MIEDAPPPAGQAMGGARVQLRALPFTWCWSLRAEANELERLAQAWGEPLPGSMLDSAAKAGRAALRLGPDEWRLLGDNEAAAEGLQRLSASVALSLVDISHGQVGLEISGEDAAATLNAAIPLDLSEGQFPPGRCTRTVMGRIEVVLWRPASASTWRLEVGRSFADYAWRLLTEAIEDFQGAPTAS